jgi:Flp pilus assembly protein TadG
MNMGRWLSRTGREDGAALVETAFVLPILLLVCVGILEFGRAYQTWQVVTNAAREGARVAILPDYTDASAIARVKTYLKNGGLPAATVDGAGTKVLITPTTIPVDVGGATTASATRVVVEYPFEFMVLQPVAQLVVNGSKAGESFTMRMTTIMRDE